MQPEDYATIALRYWTTYLPSQLATIPEPDRTTFFADLGRRVDELVEDLTEENLEGTLSPTDPPDLRPQRGRMAHERARETALAELVYLPKEPGTEDRELPSR
jgi:hypothetical protein